MLAEEVRGRNPELARRLTLRAEAAGLTWEVLTEMRGSKPDGRTLARLARGSDFHEVGVEYLQMHRRAYF
jgi:hypothetical protein